MNGVKGISRRILSSKCLSMQQQHYYLAVWPDGQIVFPIFGHLQRWNFAQKHTKSPKQGFTTLPNIKFTFTMLSRISKFLLNWRIFAKSGHTGFGSVTFGKTKSKSECQLGSLKIWFRHGFSRLKMFRTHWPFPSSFIDLKSHFTHLFNTFF